MQNIQRNKGFTLIELMIVVAIIGILAAIAIPRVQIMFYMSKHHCTRKEAEKELGMQCNNSNSNNLKYTITINSGAYQTDSYTETPNGITFVDSDGNIHKDMQGASIRKN